MVLKKHVKTKKLIELLGSKNKDNILDYCSTKSPSDGPSNSTITSSSSKNLSISNEFDACTKAAMAEGKIGLRVVKYHESFNSCSNLGEFLKNIIDDSP